MIREFRNRCAAWAPVAASLVLLLSLTPIHSARAGGLYAAEFATVDMGAAGSGELARGEDASSALANPATMTRLDSHQLNLGLAPGFGRVEFDNDANTPVAGNNGGNQGGFVPLVGSSYVHKLTDRVRLGLGLFSISGAALDPDNDWAGRGQVTKISLFSLTLAPTAAVRVTDWLSIGAGPAITYATLDWKLTLPLGPRQGVNLDVKLDDLDDWAAAAIVGVLLEPSDSLRLGLLYQSETDLKLRGDTKVNLPNRFRKLSGSTNVKVDLPLPHALRADIRWRATDALTLSLGSAVEFWSVLDNTDVNLGNDTHDVHLGFKNSWKLRGGIHYQLNDQWMVQTGVSYDSSALNDSDRTAALPIDEQWRWGVGGTYDWSDSTTLGFGFEYANFGKGDINNGLGKGNYKHNDLFFFMVNLNFAKLPWDARGTW